MIRYLPANGTAGLARFCDRRLKRSPCPPARMTANTLLIAQLILSAWNPCPLNAERTLHYTPLHSTPVLPERLLTRRGVPCVRRSSVASTPRSHGRLAPTDERSFPDRKDVLGRKGGKKPEEKK